MKHIFKLSFAAMLLLSACGGASDNAQSDGANEDAEWAAQDVADAAREAEYLAWATSDERPVNLACNEPSYDRGQSETYIGLHSPLYPAIEAKTEYLTARLKELTPKTTDDSTYDVEAYNDVKYDMMMLAQWSFMAMVDPQMRMHTNFCNHEQYGSDKCTLMARMVGGGFKIDEIEKEGDALSFKAVWPQQSSTSEVEIKNADFDGVKINAIEGGVPTLRGDWQRAKDGTERVTASSGPKTRYNYTENPDCSGTARWDRPQDNGGQETLSFEWSSVRVAPFTMSYSHCKENELGERACREGGF
ncbi:MAG: hypothetical protein ABJN69_05145 [Hellea sp.]